MRLPLPVGGLVTALACLTAALGLTTAVAGPGAAAAGPRSAGMPFGMSVGAVGAAVRLTPNGCDQSQLIVDPSGHAHGFAVCRNATTGRHYVSYLEGSGSTWHTTVTSVNSFLVSVADDGVNTYAMIYDTHQDLRLVIRSRAGRLSNNLLQHTPTTAWADGSIIAAGGRWWAVWSVPAAACGCNQLWSARTMGTAHATHNTYLRGIEPFLAKRGGSAILTWLQGGIGSAPDGTTGVIAIGYPTATGFTQSLTGIRGALYPVVAIDGPRLALSWQSRVNGLWGVEFRDQVAGRWVGHRFTPNIDELIDPVHAVFTSQIPVQVSGGVVSLAWTTRRNAAVTATVLAQRVGTAWTTTLLADNQPGRHGNRLASLTMVGGRAFVAMTHVGNGAGDYYDVLRRE